MLFNSIDKQIETFDRNKPFPKQHIYHTHLSKPNTPHRQPNERCALLDGQPTCSCLAPPTSSQLYAPKMGYTDKYGRYYDQRVLKVQKQDYIQISQKRSSISEINQELEKQNLNYETRNTHNILYQNLPFKSQVNTYTRINNKIRPNHKQKLNVRSNQHRKKPKSSYSGTHYKYNRSINENYPHKDLRNTNSNIVRNTWSNGNYNLTINKPIDPVNTGFTVKKYLKDDQRGQGIFVTQQQDITLCPNKSNQKIYQTEKMKLNNNITQGSQDLKEDFKEILNSQVNQIERRSSSSSCSFSQKFEPLSAKFLKPKLPSFRSSIKQDEYSKFTKTKNVSPISASKVYFKNNSMSYIPIVALLGIGIWMVIFQLIK